MPRRVPAHLQPVLRLARNPRKAVTLFGIERLSIQALRFGPDEARSRATVPGGKVYKLNPDAAAKVDETGATIVFDAAKADDASAGDGQTRLVQSAQSHYTGI